MTVRVLTTLPPTECGIAEYASRLYEGCDVDVLASGDDWRVGDLSAALSVARRMDGGLAHVQHEWLMYGGPEHNVVPLAALAANRARGGRNVTTMHTVIPPGAVDGTFLANFGAERYPAVLVREVIRSLTRGLCGLSDRVIVHTEGAKRALEAEYGADGVRVIPHGLDPRERTPIEPPVEFCYLGLVKEAKGVGTLLSALDRLEDRGEGVDCRVVGRVQDGGFADDPRVTDAYLDEADYHAVLDRADVVVLPYVKGDYYAASGVLADAMAHGNGVIVSDIPQLTAEVTDGETGLVVPRGDPGALADALRTAADSPDEMDAMAARLHERARDRTWSAVRERTRRVYDELR